MGLILYAMEVHASAVVAFCKAIDISIGISFDGETSQTGRLQNNLGCVIFESGSTEEAAAELQQSLRNQKYCSSSDEAYSSPNLLSTSITILNIGVTCAKQRRYQDAIKHTEAAHHMQDALLGSTSEMVESTSFFLSMLRKIIGSSSQSPRNTLLNAQNKPSLKPYQDIISKDKILDNVSTNKYKSDAFTLWCCNQLTVDLSFYSVGRQSWISRKYKAFY